MNVILHIPHSSTVIPEEFMKDFTVDSTKLQKELLYMTDWYVNDLFSTYFTRNLTFPVSRLVCDVERFENDAEEKMSKKGMGVCYTKDHDGNPLKTVSEEHRQKILEKYYRPHHRKLERMVASDLRSRKYALIVDCHSFNSEPYKCDIDHTPDRPDFCIGIDMYHTPEQLIDFTYDYFSQNGKYKVEINSPFSGTIVPQKYYQKSPKVHSIMIEVNRSLYMFFDGSKSDSFNKISELVKGYIDRLSSCKDARYDLINLEYQSSFYKSVMESNQTITRFWSVEYLHDEGNRKRYRFCYRLFSGGLYAHKTCDYYLDTNYIFCDGGRLHISNRAKKQLMDDYSRRKILLKKLQTHIVMRTPEKDYCCRKEDGKYYYGELMKDKDENHTVSGSRFVEGYGWNTIYRLIEKSCIPPKKETLSQIKRFYPEIHERCKPFDELQLHFLMDARLRNDKALFSGMMYIHNLDTDDDIRSLRQYDSGNAYFRKNRESYDESVLKVKTIRHFTPKILHQKEHYVLVVNIENRLFEASWGYYPISDSMVIRTPYKNIPIKVSQSIFEELMRVKSLIEKPHTNYDFAKLSKEEKA